MNTPSRPARVCIDLDALGRNLGRLRSIVAPAAVLAVVKADAYGHGAVEVARRLGAEGVDWLGVAYAAEGVALRKAGISTPILVLGPVQPGEPEVYDRFDLTPTVSDLGQLELWEGWAAGQAGSRSLHLKVDTGMGRLGLAFDDVPAALERLRRSEKLSLSGVLSHLAEADTPGSPENERQAERFDALLALLTDDERARVIVHLANSAGALYLRATRHGMVRAGLALYGVEPMPVEGGAGGFEPVMRVEAEVVALRKVDVGARIGYAGTWVAERRSTLAVVPVGYGDGYPWRLSDRASVLAGGRRAPVVGRISMDMLTVDVTDAPVELGQTVVLLGRQGTEEIDAWELAEGAGTIAWEALCGFGLRLPRRYLPEP